MSPTLVFVGMGLLWTGLLVLVIIQSRASLQRNIKAVTEDFQAREARQRALLNNLREVVFEIDANGKLSYLNPAWEQATGYSVQESLGEDFFLHLEETSYPEAKQIFTAMRNGQIASYVNVLRGIKKDGSKNFIDVHMASMLDPHGNFSHIEGSFTDATQKVLSAKQLRDATAQAQQATQAKSDFLATISHEIRTPMNAVIGMTSLLMSTKMSSEQREYTNTIRSSGENLLEIINDVLDFSKIESGRIDLENRSLDLKNLMEDTLGLLSHEAQRKSIGLTYTIAPDVPDWIMGDVTRLRQVLVNLTANAVKFTEQGQVQVHITNAELSDTALSLRFTVTDTGIGMSAESLQNLFSAFMQADSSTTRKYGGSGLGLAISQHLVRVMGSEIKVRSTLGEGSEFSFLLPTAAAQALVDLPAQQPPAKSGAQWAEDTDPSGKLKTAGFVFDNELALRIPLRILVVDDHEINQKVVLRMLQKFGYHTVDVAANGREAVDSVVRQRYDLVLMDEQMPEMDGLDATRHIIQKCPESARPRIVAMTADVMPQARSNCLEAGMDDFVTKPVTPFVLVGLIEKWGARAVHLYQPAQWMAQDLATLDPAVSDLLLEMNAGGAWLGNIAQHFRHDDEQVIDSLHQAAKQKNAVSVVAALHGLRGISGTVGAQRMSALCKGMEAAARAGQFADIGLWITALQNEKLRASEALQSLVASSLQSKTNLSI